MITIDTLRTVDFARGYGWHVTFPSYGGEFFPAHVLNDTPFSFTNMEHEYGPYTFNVPDKTSYGQQLDLELYEITDYSVYKWLDEWYKTIRDPQFRVALVGEPDVARPILLQKLDLQKSPVVTTILLVIPENDVALSHNSEKASLLSISLQLKVVGRLS